MTPYPGGNDDYENPSLLVSSDGTSWSVPSGLTNPVVAAPGGSAFNADGDIVVDGSTMYLFYLQSSGVGGGTDRCYLRSSTDGVTWGSATELFTGTYASLLSFAVVKDGSTWRMWYVDSTTSPNKLYVRTASAATGTWSAATECTITVPSGRDLWHLDVVKVSGGFHAFICTCTADVSGTAGALHFATSTDGAAWTMDQAAFLLPTGGSAWDGSIVYRASGTPISGGYDLWYSARSASNAWRIGRTTVTINP